MFCIPMVSQQHSVDWLRNFAENLHAVETREAAAVEKLLRRLCRRLRILRRLKLGFTRCSWDGVAALRPIPPGPLAVPAPGGVDDLIEVGVVEAPAEVGVGLLVGGD